jgi:excisionase family DNA binding protein
MKPYRMAGRMTMQTTTSDTQTIPVLLLNPRQAAKALGISERTLATYTKAGLVPVVRIGRSVRYSPDDLREWIRKSTAGA